MTLLATHSSILSSSSMDRGAWQATVHGGRKESDTTEQLTLSCHWFISHLLYIQFSRSVVSDSLRLHESHHIRPPCPSPTPGVYQTHVYRVSDAIWCQWCQPSHPLSFPSPAPNPSQHQGLFEWKDLNFPPQLFAWGGQRIGVSASASVLPMNTQDWSPLGWTGWISLQSKGLSRVFSNTTIRKHQFFGAQLSSQSNSHIHTWPMEKP